MLEEVINLIGDQLAPVVSFVQKHALAFSLNYRSVRDANIVGLVGTFKDLRYHKESTRIEKQGGQIEVDAKLTQVTVVQKVHPCVMRQVKLVKYDELKYLEVER